MAHTVENLRWLLASRDYFYGRARRRLNDAFGEWKAKDAAGLAKTWAEFAAFELRYAKARERAQNVIDVAAFVPVPDAVALVSEENWDAVIRAFQAVPMHRSAGDFSEIVRAMREAGFEVTFPDIPADKSVDLDMAVYKTADDALKAVEKVVDSIGSGVPWVALGLAAVAVILIMRK